MRNVSEKNCRENQNTFFVELYIRKSCCFLDNVEKYGRAMQYGACALNAG
jgi:hypothetical protein